MCQSIQKKSTEEQSDIKVCLSMERGSNRVWFQAVGDMGSRWGRGWKIGC